jgi:hypothetical protein
MRIRALRMTHDWPQEGLPERCGKHFNYIDRQGAPRLPLGHWRAAVSEAFRDL